MEDLLERKSKHYDSRKIYSGIERCVINSCCDYQLLNSGEHLEIQKVEII